MYAQQASAPIMYPHMDEKVFPAAPVRADRPMQEQTEALIAPQVPPRNDRPQILQMNNESIKSTCTCNYNRYATKKTVGQGFMEFALLSSNAMQLRTLILQKQRDAIWIASLVLICISIMFQLLFTFIIYILAKGDIRNSNEEKKLKRWNNVALLLVICISMINVVINTFMSTINPKAFLDNHSLELLGIQK